MAKEDTHTRWKQAVTTKTRERQRGREGSNSENAWTAAGNNETGKQNSFVGDYFIEISLRKLVKTKLTLIYQQEFTIFLTIQHMNIGLKN